MSSPVKAHYAKNVIQQDITWSSGSSTVEFELNGSKLAGVIFPATMTSTTLDVELSLDGGTTWDKVYDNVGTKISMAVQDGIVYLAPTDSYFLEGDIRFNGSSEGADRSLVILSRPI